MSEVVKCVNPSCKWQPSKVLRKPLKGRVVKCDFCREPMVVISSVRERNRRFTKRRIECSKGHTDFYIWELAGYFSCTCLECGEEVRLRKRLGVRKK